MGDLGHPSFKLTGAYVPPPAGLKGPVLWGTEDRVRELFADRVRSLATARRTFTFRYRSAEHWLAFFRGYYGPTRKAFEVLEGARREAYARDILGLLERFNRSGDETMVVPSEYLEIIAVRS